MSEEIFKEENMFTQHDVENKQLKDENEKLQNEENEKLTLFRMERPLY